MTLTEQEWREVIAQAMRVALPSATAAVEWSANLDWLHAVAAGQKSYPNPDHRGRPGKVGGSRPRGYVLGEGDVGTHLVHSGYTTAAWGIVGGTGKFDVVRIDLGHESTDRTSTGMNWRANLEATLYDDYDEPRVLPRINLRGDVPGLRDAVAAGTPESEMRPRYTFTADDIAALEAALRAANLHGGEIYAGGWQVAAAQMRAAGWQDAWATENELGSVEKVRLWQKRWAVDTVDVGAPEAAELRTVADAVGIPPDYTEGGDTYRLFKAFSEGSRQADEQLASDLKHAVVRNLALAADIPYMEVNAFVSQWHRTSNKDLRSLHIQRDAAELFGADLSRWQIEQWGQVTPGVERLLPKATQRQLLAAMYAKTQASLRAAKIGPDDLVTLYRGVKGVTDVPARGTRVKIDDNAISSYSLSADIAQGFATSARGSQGFVYAIRVPARSLLSTWRTGFGCMREMEAVVLGLKDAEAEVVWSSAGIGRSHKALVESQPYTFAVGEDNWLHSPAAVARDRRAARRAFHRFLTGAARGAKHFGPGAHPGTGTPQEAHAGGLDIIKTGGGITPGAIAPEALAALRRDVASFPPWMLQGIQTINARPELPRETVNGVDCWIKASWWHDDHSIDVYGMAPGPTSFEGVHMGYVGTLGHEIGHSIFSALADKMQEPGSTDSRRAFEEFWFTCARDYRHLPDYAKGFDEEYVAFTETFAHLTSRAAEAAAMTGRALDMRNDAVTKAIRSGVPLAQDVADAYIYLMLTLEADNGADMLF